MSELARYSIYRYLGEGAKLGAVSLDSRDVFGVRDDLTMAIVQGKDAPFPITEQEAAPVVAISRPFKADPTRMFGSVNFKAAAAQAPAAPKVTPVSVAEKRKGETDLGKHLPDVTTPKVRDKTETEKAAEDIAAQRARMKRSEFTDFNARPISYDDYVRPGGSPGNYKVMQLTPFGGVHLPAVQISQTKILPRAVKASSLYDFPEYVFQDIKENVLNAIGLKVALPFNRLAIGGVTGEGTCVVVITEGAYRYGVILINPAQIYELLGGFNSKTVGQALTHEIAHFIDYTMIKNSERMRFTESLRGRKYHPQQNEAAAGDAFKEQFATLAELMVWGDSVRRVFYLNGFEVVSKYFENRYVTEIDLKTRRI